MILLFNCFDLIALYKFLINVLNKFLYSNEKIVPLQFQ